VRFASEGMREEIGDALQTISNFWARCGANWEKKEFINAVTTLTFAGGFPDSRTTSWAPCGPYGSNRV
jgi:hypothetical protein